MSDQRPSDELLPRMHPSVRNFGPDTPFDFDQESWYRWVAETTAEREGISEDAAKMAIKQNAPDGAVGGGEWTRPREEIVPLSRSVADDE